MTWTREATNSFVKLKEALASAPALGIPDLSRDFTLAVDEKKGFYSAALLQKLINLKRLLTILKDFRLL